MGCGKAPEYIEDDDHMYTPHCAHFKWYYVASAVTFLFAIIVGRASPREIRDGRQGCGGNCGSGDCCIYNESGGVCGTNRCFCSVFESNDWYCQEKEPTISRAATAVVVIGIFAPLFILMAVCLKSQDRSNYQKLYGHRRNQDNNNDNQNNNTGKDPTKTEATPVIAQAIIQQPTTTIAPTADEEIMAVIPTGSPKLGISIKNNTEGVLFVSKMEPESPFQSTTLKVGMVVTQINGTSVEGMTVPDVVNLLKQGNTDTSASFLAIRAKSGTAATAAGAASRNIPSVPPAATAPAPAPVAVSAAPVAAVPVATTKNTIIRPPPGVAASAPVSTTVQPSVTATATPVNNENSGDVIVAVAKKATPDQKLGVSFQRDPNGVFEVSRLAPTSPFLGKLEPGMTVLTVNGIEVAGKDMNFVIRLIQQTVGDVEIIAQDISWA